jgi:hypothetical protein
MKGTTIFWDVMPCNLAEVHDVFEILTASIFKIKDQKQEDQISIDEIIIDQELGDLLRLFISRSYFLYPEPNSEYRISPNI